MNDTSHGRRFGVVEPTPIGPVTVIAEREELVGLYMDTRGPREVSEERSGGELRGVRRGLDPSTYGQRVDGDPLVDEAARQLTAYFAGERTDFDLPLRPGGTDFQQRVWRALRDIPFGETWSYGELAEYIGNPTASRAVGLANGRNPISIVIPCHRVIGANGSMTGYGGGIERKRWLLAHEKSADHTAQQQLF